MAVPLAASSLALAKSAISSSPRFAAALARAASEGAQVTVKRHDKQDLHGLFSGAGIAARWASVVAGGALVASLAAPALAGGIDDVGAKVSPQAEAAQVVQNPVKRAYAEILNRDNTAAGAPSSTPVVEKATVAPNVTEATIAKMTPADFSARRELEFRYLASTVIAVGFENKVDRKMDGGAFDAKVMQHVRAASRYLLPENKLLSQLSREELQAFSFVVVQAATPDFIDQMKAQEPHSFRPDVNSLGPRVGDLAKKMSGGAAITETMNAGGLSSGHSHQMPGSSMAIPAGQASGEAIKKALLVSLGAKAQVCVAAVAPLMEMVGSKVPALQMAPAAKWALANANKMGQSLDQRKDRFKPGQENDSPAPTA